jgi:hypothetical protein
MAADGQVRATSVANGEVLRWTSQVVSAEDLRQALKGHRELVLPARAVITPLAAEQIRANGIRISRGVMEEPPASIGASHKSGPIPSFAAPCRLFSAREYC